MKRLVVLVILICGIYFTNSMLIAKENVNDNKIKVEQTKDVPQEKKCCKNVKVGEKCPKCGKVKKAYSTDKMNKACCKDVKVGEKCPKCGKVKKARSKDKKEDKGTSCTSKKK